MHDKWARCSLRISSAQKICKSISDVLGAAPSSAVDLGTPISKYDPSSGLRTNSTWILESGLGTTEPLEKHIERIFQFVESHSSGLRQLATDCSMEIFCGFSSGNGQGGFVVPSDLLRGFGESGLDLVLDLYPPERED